MPLLNISEIEDRQKALQYLNDRPKLVEDIRTALKGIPDIEKLVSAIHVAGKIQRLA
jgi:DNA mismatch repair ATPase MutS